MPTTSLIQRVERFGRLTIQERKAVEMAALRTVIVPSHREVAAQGAQSSVSRLLVRGFAYRYKAISDGRRQITAVHVPGDFCDLHNFLLKTMDDGVASFTECQFALFPHERLQEITDTYPHLTRVFWLITLIDAAVHRQWLFGLGRLTAQERIAHFLCELLVRLKSVSLAPGDAYEFPITQEELGDIFGLSTVHVNRTLQALRAEGLIELRGKTLTVLDWPGLSEVARFTPDYLHSWQDVRRS